VLAFVMALGFQLTHKAGCRLSRYIGTNMDHVRYFRVFTGKANRRCREPQARRTPG
jgi:hypothetical protein